MGSVAEGEVPVVAPIQHEPARIPELVEALSPLLNAIDDGLMQEANAIVDLEGRSVGEAADRLFSVLMERTR